jgi:hypothetical protein
MIVSEQTIPCPICAEQGKDSKIHFETSQLLSGVRFACPVCQSEIGLAAESKPQVEKAMREFGEFKKKMAP